MFKINVLIITYNQEDVIQRTLDSILIQKDYGLNKIIVSDDCSKDKTWEILQEYQKKWPHLFDIYRNEINKGIYQNTDIVTKKRGIADFYIFIAGDDCLGDDYFSNVQEKMSEIKINMDTPIGIFSDVKILTPDGSVKIKKQEIIANKRYIPFSLLLRKKVMNRSVLINDSVINKYEEVDYSKGLHCAEAVFDSQNVRIIKEWYYVDTIGEVYYSGIGISTKLAKTEYYKQEAFDQWEYFDKHLIESENDHRYAKAMMLRAQYLMNNNFLDLVKAIVYFSISDYPSRIASIKQIIHFVYFTLKIKKAG